jgi:hypothetical protein
MKEFLNKAQINKQINNNTPYKNTVWEKALKNLTNTDYFMIGRHAAFSSKVLKERCFRIFLSDCTPDHNGNGTVERAWSIPQNPPKTSIKQNWYSSKELHWFSMKSIFFTSLLTI